MPPGGPAHGVPAHAPPPGSPQDPLAQQDGLPTRRSHLPRFPTTTNSCHSLPLSTPHRRGSRPGPGSEAWLLGCPLSSKAGGVTFSHTPEPASDAPRYSPAVPSPVTHCACGDGGQGVWGFPGGPVQCTNRAARENKTGAGCGLQGVWTWALGRRWQELGPGTQKLELRKNFPEVTALLPFR